MIDHFLFMFLNLPIQFINKPVYSSVHIFLSCICVDSAAVNNYRCFCFMS